MSSQVTCVHLLFSCGCCSCSLVPLVEVVWVWSSLVSFLLHYPWVGHMLLLLQTATPLPPSAAVRQRSVLLSTLLFITSCGPHHLPSSCRSLEGRQITGEVFSLHFSHDTSVQQNDLMSPQQQQSGSARFRNFIKGFLFTSRKWHPKTWKG